MATVSTDAASRLVGCTSHKAPSTTMAQASPMTAHRGKTSDLLLTLRLSPSPATVPSPVEVSYRDLVPTARDLIDAPRRHLRRVYDWTIHWADTTHGLAALFLIAVAESSFFPIPPDVLLIAIVAARPSRWLQAALLCSAGSLLGAAIGYVIGAALMVSVGEPIIAIYGAQHHWDAFVGLAETWGTWFLAAAAFTPIPFKVATIASGAIEMPFVPFLVVSAHRTGRLASSWSPTIVAALRRTGPEACSRTTSTCSRSSSSSC